MALTCRVQWWLLQANRRLWVFEAVISSRALRSVEHTSVQSVPPIRPLFLFFGGQASIGYAHPAFVTVNAQRLL